MARQRHFTRECGREEVEEARTYFSVYFWHFFKFYIFLRWEEPGQHVFGRGQRRPDVLQQRGKHATGYKLHIDFYQYMFLTYFIYYFRSRATPRRVKTWVCPWRPPWSGTPVLRMAALPPSLFVLIGRAGCNQWDQSGPIVTSETSRDQLGLIGTNWDQLGPVWTLLRSWTGLMFCLPLKTGVNLLTYEN